MSDMRVTIGLMIAYEYIVPLRRNPSAEERRWAWKFTVLARANGKCQNCGALDRLLECAHIEAKRDNPARAYDPDNGMALCSRCHRQHDWARGHRTPTRGFGWKHSPETIEKMRKSNKTRGNDPEERARRSASTEASWDVRGRKPLRDCEGCGTPLTRSQVTRNNRFCSYACCKRYRVGKPRSGY